MGPDQPKGPDQPRRPERPGRIVQSKRHARQPLRARPQTASLGENPARAENPPRAEQEGSQRTESSSRGNEGKVTSVDMDALRSAASGLRPEFRVAIGNASTPQEAFERIAEQYAAASEDINRRAENIPVGVNENALGASLAAEQMKLRADFKQMMEALAEAIPDRTVSGGKSAGGTQGAEAARDAALIEKLRSETNNEAIRPEFKAIIDATSAPDEAYVEIYMQYAAAFDEIDGRAAGADPGPKGDVLKASLAAEKAKLRVDIETTLEAFRRVIPDRIVSEADEAKIDVIEHMPEDSAGKREAIRAFILKDYLDRNSAADNPLPTEVLRLIAQDDATTEEFVSNLIVMELENEQWQIKGFFGNINLEKFLKAAREIMSPNRRDRLTTLIDANRGFHDMNYILRRNFDQFAQQSEVIQPEHLRVLSQIPGVSEGIALYEELYTAERAREGYITEEAAKRIDFEVEDNLGKLAEAPSSSKDKTPLIKGVMGGRMDKWEVYRAHVYARDTFRILMRAVEQTSLSDLPPGNKKFTTVALGKVAMVFDALKFNGLRFEPAKQLGGLELLDRTLENMEKKRRGTWEKGGKVKVRLARVGGTSVGLMELQNIVAARGVLATWRAEQAVLAETRFIDNGEVTDVATFFQTHKEQINELKERERHGENTRVGAEVLFAPLLDGTSINLGLMASSVGLTPLDSFKELVWEKVATQDPLVMAQLLTGVEADSLDEGKHMLVDVRSLQDILVGVWGTDEQKRALWGTATGPRLLSESDRRTLEVAQLNVQELKTEIKRLEGIKARKVTDADRSRLDTARQELGKKNEVVKQILTSEEWKKLTDTLREKHRMRMSDEVDRINRRTGKTKKEAEAFGEVGKAFDTAWEQDENGLFRETEAHFRDRLSKAPKKLDDYLKNEEGKNILNAQQSKVFKDIMTNGQRIAPDLARIKRAYAWFLDDVPFQSINWEVLGQFYDREVNDLANFNKSAQALITIVNNPFGVTTEKALDTFGEAVVAAGAILNEDASQDNIQPIFETYLEMISKTGNRQIIWTELMHAFNQPTSRAQEIIGVKAPSVDEGGMRTILEESVPKHVTRKGGWDRITGAFKWSNTQAELIKHFGATPLRVFGWKNLRDLGPIGLFAILIEFFNGSFSTKSQAY